MKITVSEHIRTHILNASPLDKLRQSEWCPKFEKLMRNRLIVGAYRYGGLYKKRPKNITIFHVNYIRDKLDQYEKTGNTEMLVDIANLALVEFVVGDHPNKHFKAEDRK